MTTENCGLRGPPGPCSCDDSKNNGSCEPCNINYVTHVGKTPRIWYFDDFFRWTENTMTYGMRDAVDYKNKYPWCRGVDLLSGPMERLEYMFFRCVPCIERDDRKEKETDDFVVNNYHLTFKALSVLNNERNSFNFEEDYMHSALAPTSVPEYYFNGTAYCKVKDTDIFPKSRERLDENDEPIETDCPFEMVIVDKKEGHSGITNTTALQFICIKDEKFIIKFHFAFRDEADEYENTVTLVVNPDQNVEDIDPIPIMFPNPSTIRCKTYISMVKAKKVQKTYALKIEHSTIPGDDAIVYKKDYSEPIDTDPIGQVEDIYINSDGIEWRRNFTTYEAHQVIGFEAVGGQYIFNPTPTDSEETQNLTLISDSYKSRVDDGKGEGTYDIIGGVESTHIYFTSVDADELKAEYTVPSNLSPHLLTVYPDDPLGEPAEHIVKENGSSVINNVFGWNITLSKAHFVYIIVMRDEWVEIE